MSFDSMSFTSILFEDPAQAASVEGSTEPNIFDDLFLDQVVASVIAGHEEYNLEQFFYTPLPTERAIAYRQEVFRDLNDAELFRYLDDFGHKMHDMRRLLDVGTKLHYQRQKERLFLEAARTYCRAIEQLSHNLEPADLTARGLLTFRDYLTTYASSATFTSLAAEADGLEAALDEVKYTLHIVSNRIDVSRYDGESDYSADVTTTFEKFRRGQPKDYRIKFNDWLEMNHVEAGVLDRVALLYPEVFTALTAFCERQRGYLDQRIGGFDREIHFYTAYLRFVGGVKTAGLQFCIPHVSAESKEVQAHDTFDLALANKLMATKAPTVCNDFYLKDSERIIVVSGPNQGGKTTFSRMFGQLHYLARLGCPVPGRDVRTFLYDSMFTHFEREEEVEDLSGKLENDLVRIHQILEAATPRSIVIMNEIFNSTTLNDAVELGTKVMKQIIDLDLLCVCVTFVDELASLGETVVSMVSTVVPEDPAQRTFRVERRPADGLSYAAVLAAKYGLTYEAIKERLAS